MILGVRVLLIALLLVGSTGSARCQALCAGPADSLAVAQSPPAQTHSGQQTEPDHAGCHGGGVASPEAPSTLPGGPRDSCQDGCCTVLTGAALAPSSGPGPTSATSSILAGADLDPVRSRPDRPRHGRLPAPFGSPFHFRNPPLLI
jgi:hypothetical protein